VTSVQLARDVVSALVEAGIREVVVAPGSRNAPLSFAAYDVAAAGLVRLHTRIDERSAGFLALGLTKVGSPAAVICTSGTAVANLHPAMLEAAHAGVRLIAVTADRPVRLRGTSANQTTDQVAIFGPLVTYVDVGPDGAAVARTALGLGDGPLHLNVQLDEPLVPTAPPVEEGALAPVTRPPDWIADLSPGLVTVASATSSTSDVLARGPRTVVVAGDDAGPPARMLAEAARWPLLAEPTSGSRTGDAAIRTYRLLLGGPLADEVERVVVFGHPTLSRPVTRLLQRDDVEVLAAPARGAWAERPFEVSAYIEARAGVQAPDESDWFDRWKAEDARVSAALDRLLADEEGVTPHEVAGAVAHALPAGGLLVVGASNPVRDLDLMVPRYDVGTRRKTIANRGLSGIDGTVSTAVGAALGRDSTRTFALMGDVTFLHDSNGLVHDVHDPEPDLTIVVVNDDGGSIFATLEQGAPEHADRFDRLFGTPHGVDLASLCAATRTPHWAVGSLPELEQALASPNGGIEVVEVRVRRDNRRDLDQRIRALVSKSDQAAGDPR
jgi:2-succinyl-5-enolpyruvyl-6-hydroxy-3-cyclohexene-1-carboxylate synthase